jgi:hypothetical protein
MKVVGWRGCILATLGALQACALAWGSGGTALAQLSAVLAAAALGSLAIVWVAFDTHFSRVPLWGVLSLALLLRLVAVQADPLLEDDHFRYLWDGMRTALHFDPYQKAPSAFFGSNDLTQPWQDILSGINNPDIPTIYGPVLQALFALAYFIAPGQIGAVQGLLLLVDLACMALLVRQRVDTRWLLAYALHPMILKEAMASAHPDGLVALWLLLALAAWQRRSMRWAGALLGLAVATKVAALVVVPLFLLAHRRGRSFWRTTAALVYGFVLALALVYLPFLAAGSSDAGGLKTFAEQWRFNPLLFRLIEATTPHGSARPVAGLLIAAGVAALAWRQFEAPTDGSSAAMPPVASALLLLLLLSPVVNPWYALWALGPAMAGRQPLVRALVVALGCVGVLAYLNGSVLPQATGWAFNGSAAPFAVAWPVALVQIGVLALVAVWAHRALSPPAGVP